MSDDALRKKLAHELGPVRWSDLNAHAKRGGLLLVEASLDVVEVAMAVAGDDVTAVQTWLAEQRLTRPTAEQISHWSETPEKPFISVVVQPFALAQLAPDPDR